MKTDLLTVEEFNLALADLKKEILDSINPIKKDISSMKGERTYNIKQTAKRLNRAASTIYRWCDKGFMEAHKNGGSYQIKHSTIEDFIKTNNKKSE